MAENNGLIYRVRPINKNTLDEVLTPYLWFSRPEGFKGDHNDANIRAFVENTEAIKKGIEYWKPEFPFEEWYEGMAKTGICCFTRNIPRKNSLGAFPKCGSENAICIEYDKYKLTSFFETHPRYPLYPCFHKVEYSQNPTRLEMLDDWSILWSVETNHKEYRTLPGILNSHPRELDKFLFKLLSRLSSKFKRQKEERIIIGGRNIPDLSDDSPGYKIPIPEDAITRILVYKNVPQNWIEELLKSDILRKKVEFIN